MSQKESFLFKPSKFWRTLGTLKLAERKCEKKKGGGGGNDERVGACNSIIESGTRECGPARSMTPPCETFLNDDLNEDDQCGKKIEQVKSFWHYNTTILKSVIRRIWANSGRKPGAKYRIRYFVLASCSSPSLSEPHSTSAIHFAPPPKKQPIIPSPRLNRY